MIPSPKPAISSIAAKFGVELRRTSYSLGAIRNSLLSSLDIDTVIDVGANIGQYGNRLRASGYEGRIISFEPLPEAFEILEKNSDAGWDCNNFGLGAASADMQLNIAEATDCSSLLQSSVSMRRSYSAATPVAQAKIQIRRLDDLSIRSDNLGMKIDTQGFEHQVLDGAGQTLGRLKFLEIEMALSQNYEGGSTLYDLLPRIHDLGFEVAYISNGFTDLNESRVLDADFLMVRRSA